MIDEKGCLTLGELIGYGPSTLPNVCVKGELNGKLTFTVHVNTQSNATVHVSLLLWRYLLHHSLKPFVRLILFGIL